MRESNIERGDTFIVDEEDHRGRHYTCVGTTDDGFFAGDTSGQMYLFEEAPGIQYKIYVDQGPAYGEAGTIYEESIELGE